MECKYVITKQIIKCKYLTREEEEEEKKQSTTLLNVYTKKMIFFRLLSIWII